MSRFQPHASRTKLGVSSDEHRMLEASALPAPFRNRQSILMCHVFLPLARSSSIFRMRIGSLEYQNVRSPF